MYLRNYIERNKYCHTCLNGIRALGKLSSLQVAEEDWTLLDKTFADQFKFFEEWNELKGLAEETITYCQLCKASFSPGYQTVMKRGKRMFVPCMEADGTMYVRSPEGVPGMPLDADGMPDWDQLRKNDNESIDYNRPSENPEEDDADE